MDKNKREELRNIIISQIDALKEEMNELVELTKPVSLDASIGRISRMDAINNKAINEMALREKKKTLKKLEQALERVEDNSAGKCLKCGGDIPFGRLEFMPYTTRCIQCAN